MSPCGSYSFNLIGTNITLEYPIKNYFLLEACTGYYKTLNILVAVHQKRSKKQEARRRFVAPIWFPLLFITTSLLLLVMKMINRLILQRTQLPPGPPRLPILGNLHQLGKLLHHSLYQLSEKYGPVMLIHLGNVPALIISSSEAAREMFKTHDLDCSSRPALTATRKLSYNFIDVAFSADYEYWKEMTKITRLHLFCVSRVESFRWIREEEVSRLVLSISESCLTGEPVNLSEEFICLTASMIGRIAFGKSFGKKEFNSDKFEGIIHEATIMLASFGAADFLPYVGSIIDSITGIRQRLDKCFKDLDGFYQKVIDDHVSEEMVEKDHEDIIDVLLKIKEYETESGTQKFTHDHIKAILMNLFLAGVDTAAETMVWVMSELARNPRVLKRAREEIRNKITSRSKVCEDDLDKFPYLKMVIKETFRLHPPVALIPRAARNRFSFRGYTIEPKTLIQVNAWAIGRDPAVWDIPEEFWPERFLDTEIDFKGQDFVLLPFGSGRRRCPGIGMAAAEMELTLANLLLLFDWKLPSGMKLEDLDMDDEFGITIHKKVPLKLVPTLM